MKSIKIIFAAVLMAMAGTASAQTTGYVHIIKTDGTKIQFRQSEIQSMTVDTKASPTYYVEFTHNNRTVRVATMNLGATTVAESAQTCYGNYYAWAATVPSDSYTSNNAPYYNGSGYTKYTSSGATLEASDDAATYEMGNGWHIPTQADFQTLYNACGGSGDYITPTTISSGSSYSKGIYWLTGASSPVTIGSDTYKVNGLLFVQDADTHVFFPAAGYIRQNGMNKVGQDGNYWTSTLNSEGKYPFYLWFGESITDPDDDSHGRHYGLTIRPFKN